MDYAVVIEKTNDGSFSAYVPDMPGCVTCGDTVEETRRLIEEGAILHLQSSTQYCNRVALPIAIAQTPHEA